jgi:dihydrodipicolinate synthase/N-acetylneuraminate lyase
VRDIGGEVEGYFKGVIRVVVLPIVVYNYSRVVGRLDLDLEALVRLVLGGEGYKGRIIGTKFTYRNIGKLVRVTGKVRVVRGEYRYFSGVTDTTILALVVEGYSRIVGAVNVFPRAYINVYRLFIEGK